MTTDPIDYKKIKRPTLATHPSQLWHLDKVCADIEQLKLYLLIAPSGYGKTTLLLHVTQELMSPVCWYSLETEDKEPALFAKYLVTAIQQQFPAFGQQTLAVLKKISLNPAPFIDALGHEMQTIDQDFILILDNFHQVQSAMINILLQEIIRVITPKCHLVIASQTLIDFPDNLSMSQKLLMGGLGITDLQKYSKKPTLKTPRLTEREREIVALLLQGHSPSEIAAQLYLQPKTVNNYFRDLRERLGLKNQVQLALTAQTWDLS